MTDKLPSIIGVILGLVVSLPIAVYMFRECFKNYVQFKKEIKEARGSETEKLLDGEFTKAVNHQFSEAKAVFVVIFPIAVFLFVYVVTSSIASTAIELSAS